MNATIKVRAKDRQERAAIQRAVDDEEMRVLLVVVGHLMPFTKRTQGRILTFVMDALAEDGA